MRKANSSSLTDDDFKAAAIESSKTIEIMDFVNADEVDAALLRDSLLRPPGEGR